jgi:hypothetical protein
LGSSCGLTVSWQEQSVWDRAKQWAYALKASKHQIPIQYETAKLWQIRGKSLDFPDLRQSVNLI